MSHQKFIAVASVLSLTVLTLFLSLHLLVRANDIDHPAAIANTKPDTVVFVAEPDLAQAITRLSNGELDLYAGGQSNSALAATISNTVGLDAYTNYGLYSELTFNPAGPVFSGTGKLNPFAVPRVREAMNMLLDREYIAQEIMGGLATPKWMPIHSISKDYNLLADTARALESQYAYNPSLAQEIIAAEMLALGATLVNNEWHYGGQPVEIIMLIRNEDIRMPTGAYVADQLDGIGFSVVRNYMNSSEASAIWISSDPSEGLFHIYTGVWGKTAIARDSAGEFAFFYTDMGVSWPLWQAYENSPEFYELARRLNEHDYTSLSERESMMARALVLALEDSVRIWIADWQSLTPKRQEIELAADLFGGALLSKMWPQTIQRTIDISPSVPITIGLPSLLDNPWNPLSFSWVNNSMPIQATREDALLTDPYNGLPQPQRIISAAVQVADGFPVTSTLDWVHLQAVQNIVVPDDAWSDWDAASQTFLTASAVYTQPQTAQVKTTVYYSPNLNSLSWHDGSPFSMADVIMKMIVTFDRTKPESAVFDEAAISDFDEFVPGFKGMRIVSEDPLIIEHYADNVGLDAELLVNPWWPEYRAGPGAWHNLALGLRAEAAGQAAFTRSKANADGVEWLNYIDGPSLTILSEQLSQTLSSNYIPYSPTLSTYITAPDATARWANLDAWYQARNHFWIGAGPFYLLEVWPAQAGLVLQRYPGYFDDTSQWDTYLTDPTPQVTTTGPNQIESGDTAVYTVTITLGGQPDAPANQGAFLMAGQPYPSSDLESVSYLILDEQNATLFQGDAEFVAEGVWRIVLDASLTSQLPGGENRLEIVVTTSRTVIPGFGNSTTTSPYYVRLPLIVRTP